MKVSTKEAYITGLYLAKFEELALEKLECKTWMEAYMKISNILGYLHSTIKHHRDSFDALLPNKRNGWHKRKPYQTVQQIFDEFGDYSFDRLTQVVEQIFEEHLLSNLHNSTYINNLDTAKKETFMNIALQEKKHKNQEMNQREKECVLNIWEKEGGKREVPIFDCQSYLLVGIADLVTQNEIIEVKDIKNWKHAIGQVFAYWRHYDLKLIPRIHLFSADGANDYRIELCKSLMEEVFYPHTNLTYVTSTEDYKEYL